VTPRETLDELPAFFAATPELEAATVARPVRRDEPPQARTLNLASDAESFFRDVIVSAVIDQLPRWSLKELDPVYKPETDEVEWVEADSVAPIRLALDRYSNLGPLQPFQPADRAYIRRLQFWVCILTGAEGRRAYFFRAFSAASELRRKRGAALVSRDGAFTKVEEQVFLFDDSVDCLVFGDYLFVLRKSDYRRIFDQLEAVRQRARVAAAALHAKVPIANFDEFAEACSTQAAMADKLIAVQSRDYFDRLSYEMLRPVIEEFQLKIAVETRGGTPHLVFQTQPEQRWRILRLVDDDFLKSSMTDHRYEVNSKAASPA
jgi:Domain of unknown function (DUF4868)